MKSTFLSVEWKISKGGQHYLHIQNKGADCIENIKVNADIDDDGSAECIDEIRSLQPKNYNNIQFSPPEDYVAQTQYSLEVILYYNGMPHLFSVTSPID